MAQGTGRGLSARWQANEEWLAVRSEKHLPVRAKDVNEARRWAEGFAGRSLPTFVQQKKLGDSGVRSRIRYVRLASDPRLGTEFRGSLILPYGLDDRQQARSELVRSGVRSVCEEGRVPLGCSWLGKVQWLPKPKAAYIFVHL